MFNKLLKDGYINTELKPVDKPCQCRQHQKGRGGREASKEGAALMPHWVATWKTPPLVPLAPKGGTGKPTVTDNQHRDSETSNQSSVSSSSQPMSWNHACNLKFPLPFTFSPARVRSPPSSALFLWFQSAFHPQTTHKFPKNLKCTKVISNKKTDVFPSR